jgi:predicted nucleic acid-binding protein
MKNDGTSGDRLLRSSVLLRVILDLRHALKEWPSIERGVASALIEVECLRTLDRVRLAEGFDDAEVAVRREAVYRLIEAMEIVELMGPVLSLASQPLPTALGTLDALHLETALLWREQTVADLVMTTHDAALATAAKASGLRVIGV